MNKTKTLLVCSILASSMGMSQQAVAENALVGNVGFVSEYHFRGVLQNESATVSAGVDYDFGDGFAAGIWTADVVDGVEYDLYGSYSGSTKDFNYSAGFTGYYYTGQFDSTYEEINLNISFDKFSVEYSIGNYDGDFNSGVTGNQQDYTFAAVTYEHGNGAYATYGMWGDEAAGTYIEVGYGMEYKDLEVGIAVINGDDQDTTDNLTTESTSITMSIGKSFNL